MTTQRTCEQRIEGALEDRLKDIRLMLRGAELEDVELVDEGTLDTVLHIGDYEHRMSDTREYRDEETGALDLEALFDDERDAINDALREQFYEYGLSFEFVAAGTYNDQREAFFRFLLSYGGPSDELRFFVNLGDLSCHRVQYHFMDWFDGAHRVLTGEDEALALEVWEYFRDVGAAEAEAERARSG